MGHGNSWDILRPDGAGPAAAGRKTAAAVSGAPISPAAVFLSGPGEIGDEPMLAQHRFRDGRESGGFQLRIDFATHN